MKKECGGENGFPIFPSAFRNPKSKMDSRRHRHASPGEIRPDGRAHRAALLARVEPEGAERNLR